MELIDKKSAPRMPWHDIHTAMVIVQHERSCNLFFFYLETLTPPFIRLDLLQETSHVILYNDGILLNPIDQKNEPKYPSCCQRVSMWQLGMNLNLRELVVSKF